MTAPATFQKEERIISKKLIDELFEGGHSHSLAAFPLRVIYLKKEHQEGQPPVQVLISVSKRHFHHAVDRNRVKRQIREAYRHHKHLLSEGIEPQQKVAVAFIWLSNQLVPSDLINSRMKSLLEKVLHRL
ncbi:ribonuclease P protein component [uncultured Prevotella sp.]|uniref:ribonuclease P protein component n=1 Tax=uncultured Prevotella sp. TaxID=159272 RepID=UPI0025D4217D|nr:ribonuclease P protein component [uncultured Prevotella sp.]